MIERATDRFRGPEAKVVEGLLRHYYASAAPDDLEGRDNSDLYGAALCHWQLARRRAPGTANLRVYTPSVGEDGWQTQHSVIDVVTDDMPFLLDSVLMAIEGEDLGVHLVAHPVLECGRDEDGLLRMVAGYGSGGGAPVVESLIHIEFDRIADASAADRLCDKVTAVLDDVRNAVNDWQTMRASAEAIIEELDEPIPGVADDDRHETAALLRFLLDDHFTFIGYREYELIQDGDTRPTSCRSTTPGVASSPARRRVGDR